MEQFQVLSGSQSQRAYRNHLKDTEDQRGHYQAPPGRVQEHQGAALGFEQEGRWQLPLQGFLR